LSDSVSIAGDSASTLRVSLNEGSSVFAAQRSVISEATNRGAVVTEGAIVGANVAYIDSVTGEVLEVSPTFGTGEGDALFLANAQSSAIVAGTLCAAVGDTLAIALSADESAAMGMLDGSLVTVVEVVSANEPRAHGAHRLLPSGFPAVAINDQGQPGVVLPPQQAPSEVRSALRIEGTGDIVAADQSVIGNVLTVSWSGAELKNTWPQGPQSFGTEEQAVQAGASFRSQLTGYPVGSQVVVIEPGDGGATVSVVDILAVA
jgi:peptidylprolyl isomerase